MIKKLMLILTVAALAFSSFAGNLTISTLSDAKIGDYSAMEASPAPFQVNTNLPDTNAPATAQTFFSTATQWLTAFDTNSQTFVGDKLNISVGVDTVNNQNMAASFVLEANLGALFSTNGSGALSKLSFESVTRNGTAAGTIVSEQLGLGINFVHYDTKLTGYIDVGRKFDTSQNYIAPGVRLKKAFARYTYGYISIETPIYIDGAKDRGMPAPTVGWGTGFVF